MIVYADILQRGSLVSLIILGKQIAASVVEVFPMWGIAVLRYDQHEAPIEAEPIQVSQSRHGRIPTACDWVMGTMSPPNFVREDRVNRDSIFLGADAKIGAEGYSLGPYIVHNAVDHCFKKPLRFLPVHFLEVPKAALTVAIPPEWLQRQCHPSERETYIQVRAVCAETGLRPADIVVAIHDKVPKLVDCYDGTRVPFRVIRGGKEISVEVSTFSIDSFHSKSVVICCGMMIEDALIQIGVTTRNKAGGTLYIREI